MTGLPAGWAWATVGEVGNVMLGRQRAPKYHDGPHMRPYLRVKNVFEDRIDLTDVKQMEFSDDEYQRYKLEPGDILLNEGQSPELIGRPAMYRGELPGVCFTNSLIRFNPRTDIDGRYALYLFRHYLRSGRFRREARITTNIAHLSSQRFKSIEFPVPPLNEQRLIVAAIEERFSRLDAADESLGRAEKRLAQLRGSLIGAAVGGSWPLTSLADVLVSLRNGLFVSRPAAEPPGTAIFRISAVRPMSLDVEDVRYAPVSEGTCSDYLVAEDDLLFTRYSGNAEYVGACARVPPLPRPTLHPDKLIRAVIDRTKAEPAFIELSCAAGVTREQIRARRKTTAGQVGIAGGQLRSVPIPLPPLEKQRAIVGKVSQQLSLIDAMHGATETAKRRSAGLRRSVLELAFRGELVPQDPTDEPASALLERIAAERSTDGNGPGLPSSPRRETIGAE